MDQCIYIYRHTNLNKIIASNLVIFKQQAPVLTHNLPSSVKYVVYFNESV